METREKPAIRGMTLEDVAEVYRLGSKIEEFRVDDSNNIFWPVEILQNWTRSEKDVALVADYQGQIGGFVLVAYNPTTRKAIMENCLRTNEKPIFRGYGRLLMQEAEKILRNKGAKYLCGFIEEGNTASLNMLRKLNYSKGKKYHWMSKVFVK